MENVRKTKLSDYSIKVRATFWGCSIVGLLIFVIPLSIHETSQIGLVHIGNLVTRLLGSAAPYIICVFALCGVVLIAKDRKNRFHGFFNVLMSALSLLGAICMLLYLLGAAPPFLKEERFMPFIINQVLYPTLLYTGISPFFMPFLIGAGLLEAVGVALKPILRPTLKLPGRAAIITISAFFGSAPVGIVTVDNLYKDGRLTYREAFSLGTGFATTAISFMVILSDLGGIADAWGIYFFVCIAALIVIAMITVRIYPTKNVPETTYNDVPYVEEEASTDDGGVLKRMLLAGYAKAETMEPLGRSCLGMVKTSAVLLCNIMASTCGMVIVGLVLNYYTPILEWLGYLFYPFAWVAGLADPLIVGKGAASALLVPSLPAVYAASITSLPAKIVLCAMPVLSIISIPLTMPVFFNAECKYKARDLFIIYVERMILTIIIVSILARICVELML